MSEKRLRILFLLSQIGGGAEVCVELAAGLRERGVETEVLAPVGSRAHELDAGVRFRYFEVSPEDPASELDAVPSRVRWGFGALRELERLESEFDLVFAHLPWGVADLYAYRRRRPLVGLVEVTWSDFWPLFNAPAPTPPGSFWANWRLNDFLLTRTMRGCDALVSPSAFLRDRRAGLGLPIEVIRYGRDPRAYRHDADRALEKARLGLPPDEVVILAVGYQFARKGFHLFAELASRIRDAGVRFVAVGPRREDFAYWLGRDPGLAARLTVVHGVHNPDVNRYYACADIFVFPTFFEGLPLSPLEAMASGTAVVAHRAASVDEEIEDGVDGLLVPVGDLDALEARVRSLIADPARRRELGDAGRARFRRDFTLERMVGEYETFFRRFAKSRS